MVKYVTGEAKQVLAQMVKNIILNYSVYDGLEEFDAKKQEPQIDKFAQNCVLQPEKKHTFEQGELRISFQKGQLRIFRFQAMEILNTVKEEMGLIPKIESRGSLHKFNLSL